MGEIAEMTILGLLCQSCGSLIDGDVVGYPRECRDCKEED
jgi:hypothetical protein